MKKFILFAILAIGTSNLFATQEETMEKLIKRVVETAKIQTLNMADFMRQNYPEKTPKTANKNGLVVSNVDWWCSGFFPGSLWYIYEFTNDENVKRNAEHFTKLQKVLINSKTNHDIGFQIYCSYGNAYRLTKNKAYKDIIITAADKLCMRFSETVNAIRSWDFNNKGKWQYPVIIDNMMNLELLTFAAENSENSKYMHVAKSHADKTMENHFRPDFSCFHLVSYDTSTGKPLLNQTWQGLSDHSS